MSYVPQRTALGGPALIRLLARLARLDVADGGPPLSERLSQWLPWTDAIALSATLSGGAPAIGAAPYVPAGSEAVFSARVRDDLRAAIARACGPAKPAERARLPAGAAAVSRTAEADDWTALRQRYLATQQTMASEAGKLRGRLRTALAAKTPETARLAAIDAVMERALGVHEHNLFAMIPNLLERHFKRLREADAAAAGATGTDAEGDRGAPGSAAAAACGEALEIFRRDMHHVLLAELDVRLQPAAALLAALHDC